MHTFDEVNALYEYDPKTGFFRWKIRQSGASKKGWFPGSPHCEGGFSLSIGKKKYLAHRVAFLLMTGAWPTGELDHKNLSRADNRWENLRPATRSQNAANFPKRNRTGFTGVFLIPNGRYQARLSFRKSKIYLGTFDTPEQAYAAWCEAAKAQYGEFFCGRQAA